MNLSQQYKSTRARTIELCKPLKTEDYVPQPVEYISPPKWHLAHTTWFFEEMVLSKFNSNYKRFHPDFAFLFNSYYNTIGERTLRADRGNMTRPTVEEVYAYRTYVDHEMETFLAKLKPEEEAWGLIELGLNHEQQHQELLITDLKFTFGHNPTFPVYDERVDLLNSKSSESGYLEIKEGLYNIGHQTEGFYFDNERDAHKVYLNDFKISTALVSNKEYLEFVENDGYSRFELWLDEGWSWLQKEEVRTPMYWHKQDGVWHQFTLSGLKPLDMDSALCHISFYEANAFAAWKGMRLPTEFEWEVASDKFDWGARWEWTNSAYLPYPGYTVAEGAVGEYNGKFMINQMVLRGASSATSPGHSRKTYRNFFHPHFQWQFTGIRLAQ